MICYNTQIEGQDKRYDVLVIGHGPTIIKFQLQRRKCGKQRVATKLHPCCQAADISK